MRETLDKLQAANWTHSRATYRGDQELRRRIGDDLLDIYAPTKSRLARLAQRIDIATQGIVLTPGKRDARPDFRLRISSVLNELDVNVGDLSVPGQAAGWAALQLYHERSGMTLPKLYAVDPSPDAAQRFQAHGLRPIVADDIPGRARELLGRLNELDNQGLDIINDPKGVGSLVVVENQIGAPLPDMLQNVKATYDFFYPEQHDATSASVAGIVGAGDVEQFHQAWNEARQTGETPLAAARLLLQSDVFID